MHWRRCSAPQLSAVVCSQMVRAWCYSYVGLGLGSGNGNIFLSGFKRWQKRWQTPLSCFPGTLTLQFSWHKVRDIMMMYCKERCIKNLPNYLSTWRSCQDFLHCSLYPTCIRGLWSHTLGTGHSSQAAHTSFMVGSVWEMVKGLPIGWTNHHSSDTNMLVPSLAFQFPLNGSSSTKTGYLTV